MVVDKSTVVELEHFCTHGTRGSARAKKAWCEKN